MQNKNDDQMQQQGFSPYSSQPYQRPDLGFVPHPRFIGSLIQNHQRMQVVDYTLNEGIRFDEIQYNADRELKKINDDLERFVRQWPPCTFIDTFKGPFFLYPWQDPVIWNIILGVKDSERELAQILCDIPPHTQLYQVRNQKLRKLTSFRIEIERVMEQLANEYRKPCFTTVVVERPRTPPKKVEPKRVCTFNIYWDFLLRFAKNCRAQKIVYGIYNKGDPQITPRFAQAKVITENLVVDEPALYLEYNSIFNVHHLVKDLLVDPDNILIWELQANTVAHNVHYRDEDFDIHSKSGIGYPLTRNDQDDEGNPQEGTKVKEEETIAWSVLDLFNQRGDLLTGNFKVPLYLPPANTNIDLYHFPDLVTRIPLTHIYMRIESYYTTDTNTMRSGLPPSVSISSSTGQAGTIMDPSMESAYWVPDLHNFPANYCEDLRTMKEADRHYKCSGVNIYIHHAEGITPERHVRIGYLIQFGKYVVKMTGGMFCFFLTKGINPFNLLGLKKVKKSEKGKAIAPDSIPFDDGVQMQKDFYRMVSYYWEIGMRKNLNVVLLYLQLKEGIRPSVGAAITKSLLEEEYDLLGYTSCRLTDNIGKIRFGTYTLPLYDGPPYIEELLTEDKNGGFITFTIGEFGKDVQEIHIPIKDQIQKQAIDQIAKMSPAIVDGKSTTQTNPKMTAQTNPKMTATTKGSTKGATLQTAISTSTPLKTPNLNTQSSLGPPSTFKKIADQMAKISTPSKTQQLMAQAQQVTEAAKNTPKASPQIQQQQPSNNTISQQKTATPMLNQSMKQKTPNIMQNTKTATPKQKTATPRNQQPMTSANYNPILEDSRPTSSRKRSPRNISAHDIKKKQPTSKEEKKNREKTPTSKKSQPSSRMDSRGTPKIRVGSLNREPSVGSAKSSRSKTPKSVKFKQR